MEEEILSRATGFAADEVLRLPPRLPGQGLHQSLIDVARAQDEAASRAELREAKAARRRAREAAAAAAAAEAANADHAGGDPSADGNNQGGAGTQGRRASNAGGGGKKSARVRASTAARAGEAASAAAGAGGAGWNDDGELSEDEDEDENGLNAVTEIDGGEAAAAAAAAYGDESWLETAADALQRAGGAGSGAVPEWDRVPTPREQGRAHDVVVTGPPLSGKSTISRALGAKYRLPTLTMDGAVKEALRLRSKLGARVRAAIHWFTSKEEVHPSSICFGGPVRIVVPSTLNGRFAVLIGTQGDMGWTHKRAWVRAVGRVEVSPASGGTCLVEPMRERC